MTILLHAACSGKSCTERKRKRKRKRKKKRRDSIYSLHAVLKVVQREREREREEIPFILSESACESYSHEWGVGWNYFHLQLKAERPRKPGKDVHK